LLDSQCTPCSAEEIKRCCYCINRCDYCFRSVPGMPLTLESPEDSDLDFKFCSSNCYQLSVQPPNFSCHYLVSKQNILIKIGDKAYPHLSENVIPCCCPISPSHKLIINLLIFSVNWAGYMRQDELAVCLGSFDGSDSSVVYVVHHARSLTGQSALEFFLLDDLSPGSPLPYLQGNEEAVITIKEMKDDNVIQKCLHDTIKLIASASSSDIPLNLFGVINILPVAVSVIVDSVDDDSSNCSVNEKVNDGDKDDNGLSDDEEMTAGLFDN